MPRDMFYSLTMFTTFVSLLLFCVIITTGTKFFFLSPVFRGVVMIYDLIIICMYGFRHVNVLFGFCVMFCN